jgi:hypothetical protein
VPFSLSNREMRPTPGVTRVPYSYSVQVAPKTGVRRPAVINPGWLVWATWIATTVVATVWVVGYGRRFPYSDDWRLVDVMVGDQPMTLEWLWSQHDAHRLVVVRLVMTYLTRWAGGDFRATLVFNLVLLSVIAAAAILVLRRVRGRTKLVDAFFPIVLLSLGVDGLNYGFQMQFVCTSVAAIGVLLVMVRHGLTVPPGGLWLSAGLMLVLLGQGGPGLAMLLPLCVWLMAASIVLRRTRSVQGTLLITATALLLGGMGAYFIGFEAHSGSNAQSVSALATAIGRAASASGGDRMSDLWPWSGIGAVLLFAVTTVVLLRALRADRQRAIALTIFGAAVLLLVLAIAWGRGGMEWFKGLEHHYTPLLLPFLCWMYIVWDRYGGQVRAWAGVTLAGLAILIYAWGVADAQELGPYVAAEADAFNRDLCAGVPADKLAARHTHLLYYVDDEPGRQLVANGIETLRKHRFVPFGCGGN